MLKAHAVEARSVVRQALGILTPAVPTRMEDGNVSMLRLLSTGITEQVVSLPINICYKQQTEGKTSV